MAKIGVQPVIDTKTSPAWFYPGACCFICPRNGSRRWKVANPKSRKQKQREMSVVFRSA